MLVFRQKATSRVVVADRVRIRVTVRIRVRVRIIKVCISILVKGL
tara:strand:- start:273 stop:407 length:135 start_codon:yes stop_codon:yes gene_type:complete